MGFFKQLKLSYNKEPKATLDLPKNTGDRWRHRIGWAHGKRMPRYRK